MCPICKTNCAVQSIYLHDSDPNSLPVTIKTRLKNSLLHRQRDDYVPVIARLPVTSRLWSPSRFGVPVMARFPALLVINERRPGHPVDARFYNSLRD